MEHSDALRLHAAEKYILGELPSQLRDEYEEHYFGCQECAGELKMTAAFMDGSRAILLAERGTESQVPEARVSRGDWFTWPRLRFAIPVFATLLLVVCYQNFVTIPRLKTMSAANVGLHGDLVSLIGANSRGGNPTTIQIHQTKPAILEVDVPSTSQFSGYLCRLQNQAGISVYEDRISSADAKKTLYLIVPQGKLQPGKYDLVIFGQGASKSGASAQTEIEHLAFEVAILP
jgi:hypothetical protein